MEPLTIFERAVYNAIYELAFSQASGEANYTDTLVSFLKGTADEHIPWDAIKSSKVFGRFPKTNILKVILACKKLEERHLVKGIESGDRKKYVPLGTKNKEVAQSFAASLTKDKRNLLLAFSKFIVSYCPDLSAVDAGHYYFFEFRKKAKLSEYNLAWLENNDRSSNKSLSLYLRTSPFSKAFIGPMVFDFTHFYDCIEDFKNVLRTLKYSRNLSLNESLSPPSVPNQESGARPSSVSTACFNSKFNVDRNSLFINDQSPDAEDARLTLIESSPFNFFGGTEFFPNNIISTVKGASRLEVSLLRWKMVCWSKNDAGFVDKVLIVSKKNKDLAACLSIAKRRVLFFGLCHFSAYTAEDYFNENDLLDVAFK